MKTVLFKLLTLAFLGLLPEFSHSLWILQLVWPLVKLKKKRTREMIKTLRWQALSMHLFSPVTCLQVSWMSTRLQVKKGQMMLQLTTMQLLRKKRMKRLQLTEEPKLCNNLKPLKSLERIWSVNSRDMLSQDGIEPRNLFFLKKTMDRLLICGQLDAFLLSSSGWWNRVLPHISIASLSSLANHASLLALIVTLVSRLMDSQWPETINWLLFLMFWVHQIRTIFRLSLMPRLSDTSKALTLTIDLTFQLSTLE